jgi:hypothetical protein
MVGEKLSNAKLAEPGNHHLKSLEQEQRGEVTVRPSPTNYRIALEERNATPPVGLASCPPTHSLGRLPFMDKIEIICADMYTGLRRRETI